jgi:hypothetical protein
MGKGFRSRYNPVLLREGEGGCSGELFVILVYQR